MAISRGYATLEETKALLELVGETIYDVLLERTVEAASRLVDDACDRTFSAVDAERYVTAASAAMIHLREDLISVTALHTLSGVESGQWAYDTAWEDTDYELLPLRESWRDQPYTSVGLGPSAIRSFPLERGGVLIDGTWGYADTIPPVIKQACLLAVSRLWRLRRSPEGVDGLEGDSSSPSRMGAGIALLDPDIAAMVAPYRRSAELILAAG